MEQQPPTPPSTSWLWRDTVLADVDLRLSTHILVPAASSPAKDPGRRSCRAAAAQGFSWLSRTWQDATGCSPPWRCKPPQQPVARSLPCHRSVLASSSEYWKARVTHGEGGKGGLLDYSDPRRPGPTRGAAATAAAAAAVVTAAAPARMRLTEFVEEGELDAMEAVLRHCYTGQLCDAGTAASALPVPELLQMMVLADRFGVLSCLEHCWQELASRDAAAHDIPALSSVLGLGTLAVDLDGSSTRSACLAGATARLLSLLGDCEAVGAALGDAGSSSLGSQLLQLSLPAVLTLLGSNGLKARSENAVLIVADAWVWGPNGSACTQPQLRQVASVVRLGQLTRTFMLDVLPRLAWLQLTENEHHSLVHLLAAGQMIGASPAYHTHFRALFLPQSENTSFLSGPAAWFDGKPRTAWPGAAAHSTLWRISRQQLAAYLNRPFENKFTVEGPPFFFAGFSVTPTLTLRRAPEMDAWFGHKARVFCSRPRGKREVMCKAIGCNIAVQLVGGPTQPAASWDGVSPSSWVSLVLAPAQVPLSRCLDVECWAPYLVNGVMQVQCTISDCM